MKLGLAVIPSSEMLRAKDIAYRLRHSEARAVIAWTGVTGEVDKISDDLPTLDYRIVVSGDDTPDVSGWLVLNELMDGQEDTFEAVKTHRDDMAILLILQAPQEILKVLYIAMAGDMLICG